MCSLVPAGFWSYAIARCREVSPVAQLALPKLSLAKACHRTVTAILPRCDCPATRLHRHATKRSIYSAVHRAAATGLYHDCLHPFSELRAARRCHPTVTSLSLDCDRTSAAPHWTATVPLRRLTRLRPHHCSASLDCDRTAAAAAQVNPQVVFLGESIDPGTRT